MRGFLYFIFIVIFGVSNVDAKSCDGAESYGQDFDYLMPVESNEIKIMSYNVENLFDAVHEDGRDDYEFLPIRDPAKAQCDYKQGYYKQNCKTLDWTDEKVQIKLEQIRRVVAAQGDLPDILSVEEVENETVLSMLASYLGYEYYISTTGNDKRIELGLLFNTRKLNFKEAQEITIEFPSGVGVKKTRNILVAHFNPKNNSDKILAVYVNHWPSQASPSGARVQAAETLKQTIDAFTKIYGDKNYHAISMGDFNTVEKDIPHPFHTVLFDTSWENMLFDVDNLYYTAAYRYDGREMYNKMPPGTYFYGKDRAWNKLDRFFVTRNLVDNQGMDVQLHTYRVLAAQFMLTTHKDQKTGFCYSGVPHRYNHGAYDATHAGYSDHFPIFVKVSL